MGSQATPDAAAQYSLRQAYVFTRHGDRSPISRWKPSHAADSVWTRSDSYDGVDSEPSSSQPATRPCRPGELTSIGIRQMRGVGRQIRARYIGQHKLLASSFSADAIAVRCTGFNRTLESAYHVLSAMFPDSALVLAPEIVVMPDAPADAPRPDVWLPHMPAAAGIVAVRAEVRVPEVMAPSGARIAGMVSAFRESDHHMTLVEPLVKALQEELGAHFEPDVNGYRPTVIDLLDHVTCTSAHGLPLPAEFTAERVARIERAAVAWFWSPFRHTPPLLALAAGPLLHEIVERIDAHITDPKSNPPLVLYSGHDSTLAPVLLALQEFPAEWPPYASTLLLEIYDSSAEPGETFVLVVYNGRQLPDESGAVYRRWSGSGGFRQTLMTWAFSSALN